MVAFGEERKEKTAQRKYVAFHVPPRFLAFRVHHLSNSGATNRFVPVYP